MTLKEHIDDISNQLKQGAFANEAEVSQYIIIRVLEVLGWPRYTPKVIIPEYGVEGQRVDFALCHPPGKPRVFIEVKQVGNLDGAEEQLFGYAFREGVPIAILTDGQKWQFFHSTGEGRYRDVRYMSWI
jgi:predicted type IV restriction endonuclease